MEKENLDEQNANGIKPDVKFQLPFAEKEIRSMATEFIVTNDWNVMEGEPTDKEMTAHAEAFVRMIKCYEAGFKKAKGN